MYTFYNFRTSVQSYLEKAPLFSFPVVCGEQIRWKDTGFKSHGLNSVSVPLYLYGIR